MHKPCVASALNLTRGAWSRFPHRLIVSCALVGTLSACMQPPSAFAPSVADPANAEAPVAAVAHHSTIGRYQSQRPAEPASWREQNERVAPKSKP